MLDVISECLDDAAGLCTRLQAFAPSLSDLSDRVLHCLQGGHKLMFCGNGGSASDGAHIATEFTGRFSRERGPYRAMALSSDPGLLTCIANDYDYDNDNDNDDDNNDDDDNDQYHYHYYNHYHRHYH